MGIDPAPDDLGGRQFLEFLPGLRGGEQGLQLLLPLREGFLRSRRFP
jgi:hypothetical protein